MEAVRSAPTKMPPEFWAILGEIDNETDRGAVLVSCGYLEKKIGEMIAAYLVHHRHRSDFMNGTLGRLASRSKLALLLGLLEDREFDAIMHLSWIRNQFAHSPGVSFDAPGIVARCQQLKYVSVTGGGWKSSRQKYVISALSVMMMCDIRKRGGRQQGFAQDKNKAYEIYAFELDWDSGSACSNG